VARFIIAHMLAQRIQQQFIDSADLKYQCAQTLAPAIEAAIAALVASITGGGKVLTCGNGPCGALASQCAGAFVGRYERERPELAACCLSADATALSGMALDHGGRAVYGRAVRALGHAGDVRWVASINGQDANLLAAIEAAHERDMGVIALTGHKGGAMAKSLKDTDVHVCVPSDQAPRILEIQHLALHAMCDGLDIQLLGWPASQPEMENLS
jgi:D-sedoheptulose 7-phosphate isomerase